MTTTAAKSTAAKTTAAKKAAPAAKPATTIPVRLNLVVHVDPAKWELPAAAAVDVAKLAAALAEQGIPADAAAQMAEAAAKAQPKADGHTAVRASLREYMLATLRAAEKITASGATVADADRTPPKA